jgi:hypothetical protein
MTSLVNEIDAHPRSVVVPALVAAMLIVVLWLVSPQRASADLVRGADVPLDHYPWDVAPADFNGDGTRTSR